MKKITKKMGKTPQLVEGVQINSSGVERIVLRQAEGWVYVRP